MTYYQQLATGLQPYLSSIAAFATALVVVLLSGRKTIEGLRSLKMRQAINTDAPATHQAKKGTPTMGGILFLFGVAAALVVGMAVGFLPVDHSLMYVSAVVLVFALHLALGFLDDYLKATRGKSLGLKARQKLAGQLVVAVGFSIFIYILATTEGRGWTNQIMVWPGVQWAVPPVVYSIGAAILMIGMSNFTNLTDGLDGLAAGTAFLALVGISWSIEYLFPAGPLRSISYFGWALAGACAGFLWFNRNPARVFMGDTGSLALGSSLVAMAILGKQEIALLFFCLVFIAEGLSVVMQVTYFKLTKGKRIFRMTPLHHHFELLGWKETQVVQRFWIAGGVALSLGLVVAHYLTP
jgi:phospho-N-acetylmuramoyl-pentapeptide-transferase